MGGRHCGIHVRLLIDSTREGLSGLLLVASFPTFDVHWLAWIALVPLLLAIERGGPGRAFLLANVTGLVFFVGVFEWIWQVSAYNALDEAALGLYLAQYVGIWALGLRWLHGRSGVPAMLLGPALWVGLEYVRSHAGFLSLPWMLVGHSQYRQPLLIQLSSITGVYGLSFVIVLVNLGLADALRHRPWSSAFRCSSAAPSTPSSRSVSSAAAPTTAWCW